MKTLFACCIVAWFLASPAFADETWQPFRADGHGFSMIVPQGTRFAREHIVEGWNGLHAKLEDADFYALVRFGSQASREDLEKIALNVTKTEASSMDMSTPSSATTRDKSPFLTLEVSITSRRGIRAPHADTK